MTNKLTVCGSPVLVGSSLIGSFLEFLAGLKPSSLFFLTDYHTRFHVLKPRKEFFFGLSGSFPCYEISIAPGERNKTLKSVRKIWRKLLEERADRKSVLINIGGGMISDLGGFSAATYKRGIRFVNFPTSLLAQVDAAIGGKTGINLNSLKNSVGLFVNPVAVFSDISLLSTLPKREYLSSFSEVLKYGLIADPQLWNEFDPSAIRNMNEEDVFKLVSSCCAIKKKIVEKDFSENDLRKVLNFGHTIGHALETLSMQNGKHERLLHGEAVGVGMRMEARLSYETGFLPEEVFGRIEEKINSLPLRLPQLDFSEKAFLNALYQDKKNQALQLFFTLLKNVGEPVTDILVEKQQVLSVLNYYLNLDSTSKKK